MIGYLQGKIINKALNNLILNVNGVGYEVFVPNYTLEESKLGKTKEFFIYTHVREDEISLYGFLNPENRQIFISLISVSGIGPKSALNIISYCRGTGSIVKAIQNADVDFFSSIKGIAKKTAQKIIVELKSKLGGLKDLDFETEQNRELVAALTELGFNKEEIQNSIKGINKNLSLEEKIKLALKDKK